eukprot:UN23459
MKLRLDLKIQHEVVNVEWFSDGTAFSIVQNNGVVTIVNRLQTISNTIEQIPMDFDRLENCRWSLERCESTKMKVSNGYEVKQFSLTQDNQNSVSDKLTCQFSLPQTENADEKVLNAICENIPLDIDVLDKVFQFYYYQEDKIPWSSCFAERIIAGNIDKIDDVNEYEKIFMLLYYTDWLHRKFPNTNRIHILKDQWKLFRKTSENIMDKDYWKWVIPHYRKSSDTSFFDWKSDVARKWTDKYNVDTLRLDTKLD